MGCDIYIYLLKKMTLKMKDWIFIQETMVTVWWTNQFICIKQPLNSTGSLLVIKYLGFNEKAVKS